MKEMTWTREEALKRIAFLYHEAKNAMQDIAVHAVAAPNKKLQTRMFEDACEKKHITVGIIGAAEAIGISTDEIMEYQVDEEEMHAFIKYLADQKCLEAKEKLGDNFESILSDLFG